MKLVYALGYDRYASSNTWSEVTKDRVKRPSQSFVRPRAWAGAKDGDPADALEGGGTINSKDQVIAGGRWTFDGGHEGWNEFHATRNVQKVAYIPKDEAGFADFYKRWCDEKSKVPNTDPAGNSLPGSTPKSAPPGPPLTAKQRETYDNQQRPENQWVLHPDIDGCEPFDDPGGGIH